MKFFIDSANVKEIRELASTGLVDGVTTNPSLIAKTERPLQTVLGEICDLVDGPVSAEVLLRRPKACSRKCVTSRKLLKTLW